MYARTEAPGMHSGSLAVLRVGAKNGSHSAIPNSNLNALTSVIVFPVGITRRAGLSAFDVPETPGLHFSLGTGCAGSNEIAENNLV